MDPTTVKAIAKAVQTLLPKDENPLAAIFFIVFGAAVVLLFCFFGGPLVIHERVPMVASTAQADMFDQAAQAVTDMTETPVNPSGVPVNWQQVLAVAAVECDQDFSHMTSTDAYNIAKNFVKQTGTVTVGSGDNAQTYPVYQAVSLADVCGDLGLNINDVEKYLQYDMSFLLGDDSVADEGGRIYTAPTALKYQAVNPAAVIAYLQDYNSALANTADVTIIDQAAQAHGLNPLLLFAITGQEQCFDDTDNDNAADVAAITANPFNVYGSWQDTDFTLAQSADIAANFVAERLTTPPPDGENAIEWINDPANPNGGLYASENDSPTPGWWEGVNCFFQEMNGLAGVYATPAQ